MKLHPNKVKVRNEVHATASKEFFHGGGIVGAQTKRSAPTIPPANENCIFLSF
jgi:hypothetical protein